MSNTKMKKKEEFTLKILNQHELKTRGIKGLPKNMEKSSDACSHGEILFKVKDIEIMNKTDGDWGLMNASISLLRTIFSKQKDDSIFLCGCCEYLPSCSCPIGVNWKTTKKENKFIISKIKKYPVTNDEICINYDGLRIEIDSKEYLKIVYSFAKKVRDFVKRKKIIIKDDFNRENYEKYWKEFDKLYFKLQDLIQK